jgi:hypothetical protein
VNPCRASAARRSASSSNAERDARRRLGKDLVEQLQMLRMHVVFEPVAAILLQPRPGDDTAVRDPKPDLPLRLATLVLAQPPCNVSDVPGGARPEQPPLFNGELLHPRDDL